MKLVRKIMGVFYFWKGVIRRVPKIGRCTGEMGINMNLVREIMGVFFERE